MIFLEFVDQLCFRDKSGSWFRLILRQKVDVLTCCTRGTTTLGEQVTVEGMEYSGTSYQVAAAGAAAVVVEIEVTFAAAA